MPAGGQIHAQEGVAGLQQRHEDGRLACAPECGWTLAKPQPNSCLARSIASVLGDVDKLAAAVIAVAGIAFGVLVRQHRALRLQHRAADDVLRRDQFDLVALASELGAYRLGNLRIGDLERSREQISARARGYVGRGHAVRSWESRQKGRRTSRRRRRFRPAVHRRADITSTGERQALAWRPPAGRNIWGRRAHVWLPCGPERPRTKRQDPPSGRQRVRRYTIKGDSPVVTPATHATACNQPELGTGGGDRLQGLCILIVAQ